MTLKEKCDFHNLLNE